MGGSDPDGHALGYSIVTLPAHGVLSGTLPGQTYTPDPNYNGTDTFTFAAYNTSRNSTLATGTVSTATVPLT